MKAYKYAIFLRNPETKEVQYGTIEIDYDGFMDYHALFEKLNGEVMANDVNKGYTLISMQIIDVEDN